MINSKIVFYVGSALWVLFFSLWAYFGRWTYDLSTALIIFSTFHILLKYESNWWVKFIYTVSVNNLIDEIFLYPKRINWTEYVIGFYFLIYFLFLEKHVPTIKYRINQWRLNKWMK